MLKVEFRSSPSSIYGIGIRKAKHIMKVHAFLLRSGAVLLLLLFSIGVHAIPMNYSNITLAQGESADSTRIDSIPGVVSKTDQMIVLLLISLHLGPQNNDVKLLSMGNSPDRFALLFNFPSASGLPWLDGNMTGFPAFGLLPDDAYDADQMTRFSKEEDEIIDFLAMLGIVPAVWEPSSEHSSGIEDAPPPVVAGGVRRGVREACLHLHNEQSNKHDWREGFCPDTGLAGAGLSGARIGRGGLWREEVAFRVQAAAVFLEELAAAVPMVAEPVVVGPVEQWNRWRKPWRWAHRREWWW
jgi:hypothetical protein